MAPRKEKTEKVSGNEAADTILTYLRKQNRPYSATDVSANLHNRVSKAAAAKLLKELHERKEIEGRASGKQIVYHAIQNSADSAGPEELAAMDASIQALKDETTAAAGEAKSLRAKLTTLNATMSTVDLRSTVIGLEAETQELRARLDSLRGGSVRPVTGEEKAGIDKELARWKKAEAARGKIAKELWAYILDVLPEDVQAAELRESLGLDG
ncbi:uncharacterized protein K452DRAFT_296003 [Aplosporella prunicola CBS 121167]|uniref:Homologous-pairing protein 2 winged helix domain-containing protein n=1 Tax=Aplosporella prunicola CBS 121167 TaxID=1176127 RepID=A0A6A6BKC4_9PEZI|nr:uncharacterized protein K452DRAFT_296003 [Aplosporella prunicola CBS 121167]KAF2144572.1 hypothetical protein K452DRAFT_296003 [Aplosporella prunicola CBS 121167]